MSTPIEANSQETPPPHPPPKQGSAENVDRKKLEVRPREIKWAYETGQNAIKVRNMTGERVAFKVKTTDHTIYSVSPVVMLLEHAHSVDVAVVRAKAPLKADSLLVVSIQATEYDLDAFDAFDRAEQAGTEPDTIVIHMSKK